MTSGNQAISPAIQQLLCQRGFRIENVDEFSGDIDASGLVVERKLQSAPAIDLTILDGFRGPLLQAGKILLGVESNKQKSLLLIETKTGAIKASADWSQAGWPAFHWQLAAAESVSLARALAKILGVWALQPYLSVRLVPCGWQVLDKRQKTVAHIGVYRIENTSADATKKASSGYVLLSGVRGFANQLDKVYQTLRSVIDGDPQAEGALLADLQVWLEARFTEEKVAIAETSAAENAYCSVCRLLSVAAAEMQAHVEGMQKDIDTEFLHQYRVNLRKTRSLLKEGKSLFQGTSLAPYHQLFKRLSELSTPVRDLDVHLLMIDDWKRRHQGNVLAEQLNPLRKLIQQKRKRALTKLLNYISTAEYDHQMRCWNEFLNSNKQENQAGLPIRKYAAKRIQKCFQALVADGQKLDKSSVDEAFHDLRLDVKRFRYLLEYFEPIYASAGYAAVFKDAKKLQAVLGDFQDITVQKVALMAHADELQRKRLAGPTTFVCLGYLLQEMGENHDNLRGQFHEIFDRLNVSENAKFISHLHKHIVPECEENDGERI